MKVFKLIAAQGEITIKSLGRKTKLPDGFSLMQPQDGKYVIGHSETGHDHIIDADGASVSVMDKPPEGMRILYAILKNPTVLEHKRTFDTHEPILLEPGAYEIRIAREYDPYAELARQSAD